jgi:hypothetical protein
MRNAGLPIEILIEYVNYSKKAMKPLRPEKAS